MSLVGRVFLGGVPGRAVFQGGGPVTWRIGLDADHRGGEVVVDLLVAARPGRGCTVVEVRGDLDMATSAQLRESLQRLIDAGDRRVVVDLAGVAFMDSTGLGTLVTMFKTLRDVGGRLCLAAAQPAVGRVLSMTSVDRAIDVYGSVEAAEADVPPTGGVSGG